MVSKFESWAADFRLRTCGALHRPQDVRYAQLAAAHLLKFENIPETVVLGVLKITALLSSINAYNGTNIMFVPLLLATDKQFSKFCLFCGALPLT